MYIELDDPLEPVAILSRCMESGAGSILLNETALSVEFFDLSSGRAGDLLQKLTNYHIRLAGVVPDPGVQSTRFQEFLREANRGSQFRFFRTREEAIEWLESS